METNEEWVTCPYNANHRMPSNRFQWHLVKCPEKKRVGSDFDVCPFNAQHIVPKSELANHKQKCTDRQSVSFDESQELDKKIREYLANQSKSNDTPKRNEDLWYSTPPTLVGEIVHDDTKTTKTQKRNSRRKKKHDAEFESNHQNGDVVSPGRIPEKKIVGLKEFNQPSQNIVSTKSSNITDAVVHEAKPIKKKLQQITDLEVKLKQGDVLNEDQLCKISKRATLEEELRRLTLSSEH